MGFKQLLCHEVKQTVVTQNADGALGETTSYTDSGIWVRCRITENTSEGLTIVNAGAFLRYTHTLLTLDLLTAGNLIDDQIGVRYWIRKVETKNTQGTNKFHHYKCYIERTNENL